MIDRIFKNWKTTVVGVGLILLFGGLMWAEKVSVEMGVASMTGALLFFFAKDKKSE